jgi:sec-independent protein translocase protein TatC
MPLLLKGRNKDRRNPPVEPEEFRLTLGEHLEELRDRIVRIVTYLVLGAVLGWFLQPYLYAHLNDLFITSIRGVLPEGAEPREVFLNASDAFLLKLKLSFLIGIGIALPLIVLQLWGFVAPGLTERERRPLRRLAPLTVALFVVGAGFCYLALPLTLQFLASFLNDFQNVTLHQEAGKMVFFMLKMMIAFGIAFQLPIIVYGLGALDLLTAESLFQNWRQAITLIVLAAAIITPSGDAMTLSMMSVPLIVLFIISAFFVKKLQRRKREALERETAEMLGPE